MLLGVVSQPVYRGPMTQTRTSSSALINLSMLSMTRTHGRCHAAFANQYLNSARILPTGVSVYFDKSTCSASIDELGMEPCHKG